MTCNELREDYDAFALGTIDDPESGEIRSHIRRNCPNCVPGVQNSLRLIAQMGVLANQVEPPSRLRKRILAAVKPSLLDVPERSRFGWGMIWAAASVFLLAVSVLLGLQSRHLSALRRDEAARLERALSVMSASDSKDVTFGTNRNLPPRGRVVINGKRGVVLIASNLPPLPPGKAFELWLIPRGAKPIPSGLFRDEGDGTGIAIQTGQLPADLATVAVTIEDEGGVPAPTSTPIIAANTEPAGT